MRIIVASKNEGKLAEIRSILSHLNVEIISQKDADINVDVDETGSSFEENALIKARAISMMCSDPVLADDSGLCIDALDGKPGVYTARYGGDVSYDKKISQLLDEMKEHSNRKAKFECVMALVFPDGSEITAHGECPGTIMYTPVGNNGFGFDPVFFSTELNECFANCSEDEKNSVSHRARALKALCDKLENLLTD